MKMRKNVYQVDFDLSYDFERVLEVEIQETLTEEDIQDGIEPMSFDLVIGLSKHAVIRMEDTANRWVDDEDIKDLMVQKGDRLLDLKLGEEVAIVRDDKKLAVVGTLYQQENQLIFSTATVIRNVIMVNGQEVEKRVYITRNTKCV